MATKILVHRPRNDKAEEWTEVDVNETTLMFFDVFLASINSTWATTCENDGESDKECDYFEYYDEDGDAIVVRTDDEFVLFMSALQEFAADGEMMKIRLKSSRQPLKKVDDDIQLVDIGQQRPEDLHLLECLSEGQFGTVYKALDVRNDMFMAVKSIALDGAMNSRASILNEVEILKIACESEYVVNFYSAMFIDNELLICLELMDGLSMDRYGRLPIPVLGGVTVAVVNGLFYLWSKNIIHRDIKPSNFLVNRNGDVKLSDFGVSKQMAQSVAWSYVGTKVYMAPERITGDLYKIHSDIWSLGISLLEMALGRFPFKEMNLQHKLIDEKILKTIVNSEEVLVVGNSFEKLVEGCLKANPLDRMRPECLKVSSFICAYTPIDHDTIAKFVNDKLKAREVHCNVET